MYVYKLNALGLYEVGFFSPDSRWHEESQHQMRINAMIRVNYLNGGPHGREPETIVLESKTSKAKKP